MVDDGFIGNTSAATISDARWQLVRDLFDRVLDEPPAARAATLAALTDDEATAREVLALLEIHDHDDAGLESGPGLFLRVADDGADDDLVGQRIGPYRLVREVGRGGMGTVYDALRDDAEYEKRVAIKVIKRGMDSDAIVRRFRQERQIMAALDHPHIARLLDGAVAPDGRPYLVMEYVDGLPIDAYCDTHALGERERIGLVLSVCDAVAHAHHNLIVHRDLKPGNILVTADGVAKLLDFGIAKLVTPDDAARASTMTAVGLHFYTPEYASPEQLRDEPVSTRSDVYSLGVILYELLSGRQPFQTTDRSRPRIERILATVPEPPSIVRRGLSSELDNIILMALRKEPERRYTSVEQFAEDLRRYLDGRPVIATRDTTGYRLRKFVRRHRMAVVAGCVVALSLVGGVGATLWQAHRARAAAARADLERAQAEQVTKFFVGVLGSADPSWGAASEKAGPKTTVLEAVQNAARNVGSSLAGQPEVQATVRRTLGNTFTSLGMPDSAEVQLRAAVALRRRAASGPSLALAVDLHGLGLVPFMKGDFATAEKILRQSLATFDAVGDTTSLDRAGAESDLGTVLASSGHVDEAELHGARAVVVWRRKLGEISPAMGTGYNNLASMRNARGDLGGSEAYIRKALAVYAGLRGREHPEQGTSMLNLAYLLKWRGAFAEADSLLRQAIAVYDRTGATRPYSGYAYAQLAHVHYFSGRLGDALTEIHRARDILTSSGQPPTHPDQRRAAAIEALILTAQGSARQAEAVLRASLPGGAIPPPPYDARAGEILGAMGRVLAAEGKRAEATPLLAQSHAVLSRAFGEGDPRTRWAAIADSLNREGKAPGK